uniref:Uncharacterized protein n=1 Tax=Anopheles coluzzii TaxID=1518534 RepID=A0A8W7P9K8_ANOCL
MSNGIRFSSSMSLMSLSSAQLPPRSIASKNFLMCRRKMRWPASCPNSSRKSIHSRWFDSFFDELLQIDRWSVICVRIRRVTYSVLAFSRSFRCLAASAYDGTFDRCFALSIICASTTNARSMLMLSWADVSINSIWPFASHPLVIMSLHVRDKTLRDFPAEGQNQCLDTRTSLAYCREQQIHHSSWTLEWDPPSTLQKPAISQWI